MDVRSLDTGKEINIIQKEDDSYTLSTVISKEESLGQIDRKKVYKGTRDHFTKVYERTAENNPNSIELYYDLNIEGELPLDEFRLRAETATHKQYILDGLLELFYLVSEGKLYNIELNPFNFIASTKESGMKVKTFYREYRGLSEITDDWMTEVKKLIGYFLVSDTQFNEDNYKDLRPKDFYNVMEGKIAEQYLRIMRSSTVEQMIEDWFVDKVVKQLKGFQPVMKNFSKPKDVTSMNAAMELENEDTELENKENEQEKDDEVKEKSKKSIKGLKDNPIIKWALLAGAVLLVVIVSIKLIGGNGDKDEVEPNKEEPKEEEKEENVEVVNEDFYEGLMKSSVQKFDEAAEIFLGLNEEELNSLDEDEQVSVYITYLKSGNYDEALEIYPDGAETLVKYLKSKDKIEDIKDMESEDKVIKFEKAVVNKEWEDVLELKDDVKDKDERRVDILRALVNTKDLDGAIKYVEDTDTDMKKDLEDIYNKYAKDNKVGKKDKKKKLKKIDKIG